MTRQKRLIALGALGTLGLVAVVGAGLFFGLPRESENEQQVRAFLDRYAALFPEDWSFTVGKIITHTPPSSFTLEKVVSKGQFYPPQLPGLPIPTEPPFFEPQSLSITAERAIVSSLDFDNWPPHHLDLRVEGMRSAVEGARPPLVFETLFTRFLEAEATLVYRYSYDPATQVLTVSDVAITWGDLYELRFSLVLEKVPPQLFSGEVVPEIVWLGFKNPKPEEIDWFAWERELQTLSETYLEKMIPRDFEVGLRNLGLADAILHEIAALQLQDLDGARQMVLEGFRQSDDYKTTPAQYKDFITAVESWIAGEPSSLRVGFSGNSLSFAEMGQEFWGQAPEAAFDHLGLTLGFEKSPRSFTEKE